MAEVHPQPQTLGFLPIGPAKYLMAIEWVTVAIAPADVAAWVSITALHDARGISVTI